VIVKPLGRISEVVAPGTAVLVSGAFDPLHYGHIRYIQAAAAHAQERRLPLVAAVAPDEFVAKRHPLLQQLDERMEMIDAIRGVTYVVPQEHESLAPALRCIRPLYVVKGTDWQARGLPNEELEAIEEVGAQVVWVPVSPVSSSDLLRTAFWRFADEWVGRA